MPILIGIGCLLVIIQPWLSRRLAARRARLGVDGAPAHGSVWLWLVILVTGVYGGYFGAAQGVLLVAILGIGLVEALPRINAVKNVLALIVNGVAGLVFVHLAVHPVGPVRSARSTGRPRSPSPSGRCSARSSAARVGRRLPPTVYRVVIVVVGRGGDRQPAHRLGPIRHQGRRRPTAPLS